MKHSSLCSLSMSHRVLWGTLSSPGKGQLVKSRHFLVFLSYVWYGAFFFFFNVRNGWNLCLLWLLTERDSEPFHASRWEQMNYVVQASHSHIIWGESISRDPLLQSRDFKDLRKTCVALIIDFWQLLFLRYKTIGDTAHKWSRRKPQRSRTFL